MLVNMKDKIIFFRNKNEFLNYVKFRNYLIRLILLGIPYVRLVTD
jgi:hypothetical protein